MPIIKQIRQSRVDPKSAYLNAFYKNVTSQCGEDGIIEKIFDIIGAKSNGVSSSAPGMESISAIHTT